MKINFSKLKFTGIILIILILFVFFILTKNKEDNNKNNYLKKNNFYYFDTNYESKLNFEEYSIPKFVKYNHKLNKYNDYLLINILHFNYLI